MPLNIYIQPFKQVMDWDANAAPVPYTAGNKVYRHGSHKNMPLKTERFRGVLQAQKVFIGGNQ